MFEDNLVKSLKSTDEKSLGNFTLDKIQPGADKDTHACSQLLGKQEDHKFKYSLGSLAIPCLKKGWGCSPVTIRAGRLELERAQLSAHTKAVR